MLDTNSQTGLKKDKLLRRCERLMVKGIDSPTEISDSLGVSFNTAKSYITIIQERWADSYTLEEIQTKRKELIKKTEAVIAESWELKNNAKNTLEATGAMRTVLMAIERLQKLHGIDNIPPQPKVPKEMQISNLAHKLNTTLSDEARQTVISSIRQALKNSKSAVVASRNT